MADNIIVTGAGAVGGFGRGIDALMEAAQNPKGPNSELEVKRPEGIRRVPAYIADTDHLFDIIPISKLRRVDKISRIATLAIYQSLVETGEVEEERQRLGVILATGHGALGTTFRFMDSYLDHGDVGASPIIFSGSGNSGIMSNVTILLGLTGPALTICQPLIAVTMAYLTAACWLRDGIADAVAVGAAEEYIPLIGYTREVLYGESNKGPVRPFDFENQSSVAGEGGAFTLLRRNSNEDTGAPEIGEIGFGHLDEALPNIPDDAGILINADGNLCNAHYQRMLVDQYGERCVSYTPAFGSMLTGTAFHVAIACAQLKNAKSRAPLYCVEIFKDGQYGFISIV